MGVKSVILRGMSFTSIVVSGFLVPLINVGFLLRDLGGGKVKSTKEFPNSFLGNR